MQSFIRASIGIVLLAVVGNAAAAEPEMRCRLSGAYIKVYGKDESEQREVCARQGGEFTRYYPPRPQSGNEQQGVNAMNRQPTLRGFR